MRIAILGSAPSSLPLAPFNNSAYRAWVEGRTERLMKAHGTVPGDYDIWGCSPGCWAAIPRATVWFEIHRWQPGANWFSAEYCQFLREFAGIVFTGGRVDDLPNHRVFPIDRIEERFASYFLSSSISLMLTLAIELIEDIRVVRKLKAEGVSWATTQQGLRAAAMNVKPEEFDKPDTDDVIGLWGVDMAAAEEYCVAPETKVLTADLRWVPAFSLQEGDQVMAFDEQAGGENNYREWRIATVEKTQRLMRPCMRLSMADGTTLVSSVEHRWLTYAEHENRWRQTDQMMTSAHRDGRPTRIVKLVDVWKEDKSWEAGYLAAAFDGEGHILQVERSECDGVQFRIGFSQKENAMSEAVKVACEQLGFDLRANGSQLDAIAVVGAEDLGEQEVIGLKTSTGTFVAEGYASHNSYQRPGCQFFVLEAMRRNIGIYLPPESDLMRPMPVYGISEWDHNYIKMTTRARELNLSLQNLNAEHDESGRKMLGVQGEIHALNHFVSTWTSPYGMLPGMVIRQTPGTGLGSGITHLDGRPIERMVTEDREREAAVQYAMAESHHAQIGRELSAALRDHIIGDEKPLDALRRIIVERSALKIKRRR